MSTHTPGPWIAQLHFAQKDGGRSYAMVTAKGHLVPVGAAILGVEGCSQDEGRANARLMALSPDLFEYVASSASAGCATAAGLIAKLSLTTGEQPK